MLNNYKIEQIIHLKSSSNSNNLDPYGTSCDTWKEFTEQASYEHERAKIDVIEGRRKKKMKRDGKGGIA